MQTVSEHTRNLTGRDQFARFIPSSNGKVSYTGNGYTQYSVSVMAKTARQQAAEAEQLAIVLEGNTPAATIANIKNFLYHNFQYKPDEYQEASSNVPQHLYSLAGAWKHRESGIDCKSYSIIASQLLLNLGYKHYIRKIKQPNNGKKKPGFEKEWTHVYVVVPYDQHTGRLSSGYWFIDGVLPPGASQPAFIESKDFYMNPHYVLTGPQATNSAPCTKIIQLTEIEEPQNGSQKFAVAILEVNGQPVQTEVSADELTQMLNQGATITTDAYECLTGVLGCACGGPSGHLGEPLTIWAGISSFLSVLSLDKVFGGAEQRRKDETWRNVTYNEGFCSNNDRVSPEHRPALANLNKLTDIEVKNVYDCLNEAKAAAEASRTKAEAEGEKGQVRVDTRYIEVFNQYLDIITGANKAVEQGQTPNTYAENNNNNAGGSNGGNVNNPSPNPNGGNVNNPSPNPVQAGFGNAAGWAIGLSLAAVAAVAISQMKSKPSNTAK